MRVGDPDGHGRFGMLDEVGGRLVCYECGSAQIYSCGTPFREGGEEHNLSLHSIDV
jgi:hypothetical protein